MKREFAEISDEEWDKYSFEPSRVLKIKTRKPEESNARTPKPPPPIESFAYKTGSNSCDRQILEENLEDDDVEEVVPVASNRGRRFVVDDDEEEENQGDVAEVFVVDSSSEEELFEENIDDDDVVGKALQKCAKISAELKRELYGTSVTACNRYSEVEASSVRIVTQVLFVIVFIFYIILFS